MNYSASLNQFPVHSIATAPIARGRVWRLAVTWVLLIPLLFLAMGASLVPDTSDRAMGASAMEGSGAGGAATHQVPLAGVVLLCCCLIFTRRKKVFALCQRLKLVLAIPAFAILSVLWSEARGHTLASSFIILVFTLFAVYISVRFEPSRQLELFVLVGAAAMGLSALLIAAAPGSFAPASGWIGIFGHKQSAGALPTFFLVTFLHWRPTNILYRLGRYLAVVASIGLVIMSLSRTGWGLCALALCLTAFLWFFQKMPGKQRFTILLFVIPILLASVLVVSQYIPEILRAVGKDPTMSQRTIIWAAIVEAISLHPILGYGFAAFWQGLGGPSNNVVLVAGWVLTQAQDGYLDLCLQLGICGLALFALLLGQVGKNAARCFRQTADRDYVRWCVVIIVCALAYDIGETSLFAQRLTWFLFMLACIGLNSAARGNSGSQVVVNQLAQPQVQPA